MKRWTRRILWLVLLLVSGAALAAGARRRVDRSVPAPSSAPRWPPFDPPPATAGSATSPIADTFHASAGHATVGASSSATLTFAVDPPEGDPRPATDESSTGAEAPPPAGGGAWVLPVDGACPVGYPIKANDNSGIYHVPGGRSYERTRPERCYVDAASAAADGYRAAKG